MLKKQIYNNTFLLSYLVRIEQTNFNGVENSLWSEEVKNIDFGIV